MAVAGTWALIVEYDAVFRPSKYLGRGRPDSRASSGRRFLHYQASVLYRTPGWGKCNAGAHPEAGFGIAQIVSQLAFAVHGVHHVNVS